MKLNKDFFVSGFSYTAPTAFGTKQVVE